eukprot:137134-Prymnesium_polylepis.1
MRAYIPISSFVVSAWRSKTYLLLDIASVCGSEVIVTNVTPSLTSQRVMFSIFVTHSVIRIRICHVPISLSMIAETEPVECEMTGPNFHGHIFTRQQ